MKILILTQTFPLNPNDSTAHFMYDFAKGFRILDHQVFVVLPYNSRLEINKFRDIKLLPFRYIFPNSWHLIGFGRTLKQNSQIKWFGYVLFPFYFLFCAIKLFNVIKKHKIEVVNAHWILPNGFIAAIVCRLLNVPLYITIPGSDAYIARQNLVFISMFKFAVKNSNGIISNSPQLLKDLSLAGEILQYGVEKNDLVRQKNRRITIAGAGRLVEKKGFNLLKQAYPDCEIISGLSIEQFRQKLTGVDIFVSSTIRDSKGNIDGAPMVLTEAMAAGCAIVATDQPGNLVLVKNNYNGIVIKPTIAQIRNAINRLKKDAKLRQKLSRAAKSTIKKSFRNDIVAKSYIRLFQKAVHPHN